VASGGKQIWTEDEVMTGAEYDDIHDTRLQPQSVITVITLYMGRMGRATSNVGEPGDQLYLVPPPTFVTVILRA